MLLRGLTSLFTDISSEMVSTVLPLYLVFGVGLSPIQFGVLDGLYQGGAALVRVLSGFVGDRWQRHKEVASLGYGLSAFCKLGFVVVGGALGALSAVIVLDRTGKGIRTAPRDALISLTTPRDEIGTAFGVHRALDTTGAMLGPLLGFGLLVLAAAALGLATMSDGFVYLGLQRRLDFDTRFLPLLYVGTALVSMTRSESWAFPRRSCSCGRRDARISSDGRYGATTTFVSGHSYQRAPGYTTIRSAA